jgi:hypothetical protein
MLEKNPRKLKVKKSKKKLSVKRTEVNKIEDKCTINRINKTKLDFNENLESNEIYNSW